MSTDKPMLSLDPIDYNILEQYVVIVFLELDDDKIIETTIFTPDEDISIATQLDLYREVSQRNPDKQLIMCLADHRNKLIIKQQILEKLEQDNTSIVEELHNSEHEIGNIPNWMKH